MHSAFTWQQPVQVHFGPGCSNAWMRAPAAEPVVVLAFEPAVALGLQADWQARLGDRLKAWVTVPEGLSSLALAHSLAPQVWPALEAHAGCVLVAVGGGSTLDMAKVLRCRPASNHFEPLAQALRGQQPWPALAPAALWLLPTTAGTGSEVTRWATVWDTQAQPAQKRSLDEPWGYAQRAYVDPLLTLTCPPHVTRDCALDTLAHALEALWNHHANPISNRLAVAAARRVIAHLPACLADARNTATRGELSLAALEAGLAFSQTRTALAHALSYAVTLEQGVPHGQACALWLPTAWKHAVGLNATCDANLAEVFACPAVEGRHHLVAWLRQVGVDASPSAYGINDAPQRLHAALTSARGRNFIGSAPPAA